MPNLDISNLVAVQNNRHATYQQVVPTNSNYAITYYLKTVKGLADAKQDIIEYFEAEYRKILDVNPEDHINNFDSYMSPSD